MFGRRPNTGSEMERSWLVQRLTPKRGTANPFSFGGGYKNGGLQDKAVQILPFSFDYMGAAEFEFGILPETLSVMVERSTEDRLQAWEYEVDLTKVPTAHFQDRSPGKGTGTVYVIALPEWRTEIERRIQGWAENNQDHTQGFDLKEPTGLHRALRPSPSDKYPSDVCGWLEESNGFFFFTDKAMWEATQVLFGLLEPAVILEEVAGE